MNLQHLIATAIVAVALLSPATAAADDGVCHEDEACWDCETMGNGICGITVLPNNSCINPDGEPGIYMPDKTCFTIADYDATYSYENLSKYPSRVPGNESLADDAGLTADDNTPASERDLGAGVTAEPFTFADQFAATAWDRNPFHQPEPEVWIYTGHGYLVK